MSNIDYVIKRLKEIYNPIYSRVSIIKKEHELTYTLRITLEGVHHKQKDFEVDKNIQSVGYVINYICKEMQ